MDAATPGPRVVLVYLLDLRSHTQIMERAAAQVSVFNDLGLEAMALCMDRGLPGALPAGVHGLPSHGVRVLRAFREARRLRRWLDRAQPDLVIVRYGFATATLVRLARRLPLMLEIHSDDTRELPDRRSVRTYAKLSARLFRAPLLRNIRGAMFVSTDLERLDVFAAIRPPRAVIPNGVPVPAGALPVPDNDRAVVGYSVGYRAPWQGLDRLAQLAEQLPEFDFVLVVPEASIADEIDTSTVRIVVAEDPDHYRSLISQFDVALGGLALDRKGIEWASALKVRESVSLGIPTLLFSRDEDLDDLDTPTVSTAARGPWDPVELAPVVRDFVLAARGRRVPDEIRRRVDVTAKAARYAALAKAALGVAQARQR